MFGGKKLKKKKPNTIEAANHGHNEEKPFDLLTVRRLSRSPKNLRNRIIGATKSLETQPPENPGAALLPSKPERRRTRSSSSLHSNEDVTIHDRSLSGSWSSKNSTEKTDSLTKRKTKKQRGTGVISPTPLNWQTSETLYVDRNEGSSAMYEGFDTNVDDNELSTSRLTRKKGKRSQTGVNEALCDAQTKDSGSSASSRIPLEAKDHKTKQKRKGSMSSIQSALKSLAVTSSGPGSIARPSMVSPEPVEDKSECERVQKLWKVGKYSWVVIFNKRVEIRGMYRIAKLSDGGKLSMSKIISYEHKCILQFECLIVL